VNHDVAEATILTTASLYGDLSEEIREHLEEKIED